MRISITREQFEAIRRDIDFCSRTLDGSAPSDVDRSVLLKHGVKIPAGYLGPISLHILPDPATGVLARNIEMEYLARGLLKQIERESDRASFWLVSAAMKFFTVDPTMSLKDFIKILNEEIPDSCERFIDFRKQCAD